MSANTLQLAPKLRIDADYYGGGTFALLAKKGWGKTYAARVIAEELHGAGVPFVALDPMDAFWGLRAGDKGLPVPIFGGPHADAPLEPTAGALMADLVVEEGMSMVLSLKHFGTRVAEKRFATEFLERLYRKNEDLVHLLMDEADLFAPQKPPSGDQKLLGVTENIVRRGRNNGIGITMLTQRPAVLNKDVLTQVDGLIVGRMLGPNDRNAIDNWVGEHGDTHEGRKIKDELPTLETGQAWVWIPEQNVLALVKIRESRTFDSSPTRKRGAKAREPKGLADIDFSAIEEKMADTIERAKAEDPKELRRRIAELERELADAQVIDREVEQVPVEVAVISNDAADDLKQSAEEVNSGLVQLEQLTGQLRDTLGTARDQIDRAEGMVGRTNTLKARTGDVLVDGEKVGEITDIRGDIQVAPPRRIRRAEPKPMDTDGDIKLGKAARTILTTLVERHPMELTRAQVSTLSGYKPRSSTFANALSELKTKGLMDGAGAGGPYVATAAGFDLFGGEPPAPKSPAEVQAAWLGSLPQAPRVILESLLSVYPDFVSREDLANATDYSVTSSTWANALSTLRTNGLLEDGSSKTLRAGEALFL